MMIFNNVELELLIRNQTIAEYCSNEAMPRKFVEGVPDTHYEILVRNHRSDRIELILSVDGLAVTDGKPADSESLGFVLAASETIRIPGWLIDTPNAFTFAGTPDDYGSYVGVIGAMMFAERSPPAFWRDGGTNYILTESNGAYSAPIKAPLDGVTMGSRIPRKSEEHGEAMPFRTETVSFRRGLALGRLLIYYCNRQGLRARNIILEQPCPLRDLPDAFPGRRGFIQP